jgi:hypothetical protein
MAKRAACREVAPRGAPTYKTTTDSRLAVCSPLCAVEAELKVSALLAKIYKEPTAQAASEALFLEGVQAWLLAVSRRFEEFTTQQDPP